MVTTLGRLLDREAAGLIAKTLPEVVNHVTPDGSLPDPATLDQRLGAIGGAAR
jgi:uncharacterized protein YidB (DUF937 family)